MIEKPVNGSRPASYLDSVPLKTTLPDFMNAERLSGRRP